MINQTIEQYSNYLKDLEKRRSEIEIDFKKRCSEIEKDISTCRLIIKSLKVYEIQESEKSI